MENTRENTTSKKVYKLSHNDKAVRGRGVMQIKNYAAENAVFAAAIE